MKHIRKDLCLNMISDSLSIILNAIMSVELGKKEYSDIRIDLYIY